MVAGGSLRTISWCQFVRCATNGAQVDFVKLDPAAAQCTSLKTSRYTTGHTRCATNFAMKRAEEDAVSHLSDSSSASLVIPLPGHYWSPVLDGHQ